MPNKNAIEALDSPRRLQTPAPSSTAKAALRPLGAQQRQNRKVLERTVVVVQLYNIVSVATVHRKQW